MNMGALLNRNWLIYTVLVVVVGAACARLGIWQLDRLEQRKAFNARVNEMLSLPVLVLPADEDLRSQEYRPVQARGRYDFEHQVAIRNQVREGQYGFHLITPLRMEVPYGGVSAVLVDRGWIPAASNEQPQGWRQYDAEGVVQVQGLIRRGQAEPAAAATSRAMPPGGSARDDFWLFVDVDQISRQLPYEVLPVYVQLAGREGSSSLPAPELPRFDLGEGPHLGYAVQWFGFSAVLLVGYVMYVSKKEAARS
jgi:surfeit locus 1 family protein